jgi:Family of unknown function (DUF6291)
MPFGADFSPATPILFAMASNSFVIYRSMIEAVDALPEPERYAFIRSLAAYNFDGINPEFTGLSAIIWGLMKPQFDSNIRKRENGKKGGAHGAKGGRPPKAEKPLKNPIGVILQNPEKTPNVDVDVDVDVNGNVDADKSKSATVVTTHPMLTWIAANAPTVQRMKEPLTSEQCDKLLADLGKTDIGRVKLKDTLIAMHNRPDLVKKYRSANLTLRKWMAREPINGTSAPSQTTIAVVTEARTYSR